MTKKIRGSTETLESKYINETEMKLNKIASSLLFALITLLNS